LEEGVHVLFDSLLRKGVEETNKIIVDGYEMCGGVVGIMFWQGGKELVERLKNEWHWSESHGRGPNGLDDVVDGDGGGFEQFGHDGSVVVEDGATFGVLLFGFE
jgi:hypothetical protein